MQDLALYPVVSGKCGCGNEHCRSAGKHPDPTGTSTGGRGIITGNGLLVLYVDAKPGKPNGFVSLTDLEVPETYTVRTPTGGCHLYYKYDASTSVGNRVSFLPGLDIRGDGGFVVGPGSPHANGGTYTLVDDRPLAEAPDWLLEAARKRSPAQEVPVPLTPDAPEYEEYIRRAMEDLQAFPPAVEGNGGDLQLFLAAQIPVRKYRLPPEVSAHLLEIVYNPRCSPPWTDGKTIHRKVQEAALRGSKAIGTSDWLAKLLAREPSDIKNTPDPQHEKSFVVGSPASQQRMPLCTSDLANRLLTDPSWEGVWQYDAFRGRIRAIKPPMHLDAEDRGLTNADTLAVLNWFEHNGTKTGKEAVHDACVMAAHHNSFHPVRDYLFALSPSSTNHLDTLAEKLGNKTPLASTLLRLTLVSAVRRILTPGCQVDTSLVLYGGQGVGKSQFCQALFGEWYRSQMPDLANKDSSAALKGFWGVELAELDRVLRAESSTVKEFLTRRSDDYRPAYEAHEVHEKRQCIFIGTTNIPDFLRDPTGDRRFWPLEVGEVDLDFIRRHRDEIWSEALTIARTEEPHYIKDETPLNELREAYMRRDIWENVIKDFVEGKPFVTTESIYHHLVGGTVGALGPGTGPIEGASTSTEKRIADTMRQLRWEKANPRMEGKRRRGWVKKS